MKPNPDFVEESLVFWANIKLISEKLGYTDRKTKNIKAHSLQDIVDFYSAKNTDDAKQENNRSHIELFEKMAKYFKIRANLLNNIVKSNLMDKETAKKIFMKLRSELNPKCPLPMNKQKKDKRTYAYFTCIINMLIEANSKQRSCDFDPKELTRFEAKEFPLRVLSRRVDGAFPSIVNPSAIWEIKEYYSTTSFGSRVADAVYETTLDGMELNEVRENLGVNVAHYLMIDDYNTWWKMGKSYLCRICDILHMGLITEAIFGKEVLKKIPLLVKEWEKT